jgi:hypothetical protein
MANEEYPRGLFTRLGAFFRRLFSGKGVEEPLPAEVPKSTEELRRLIVGNERRGVDVNRAWGFYERAKENKEYPQEAAKFIEQAFNELSRKKQLRMASTSALNYAVGILFMALFLVVLWFLLRDNASPVVQVAIWSPFIVILYLIKGLISSGFKIASTQGVRLELPEKVPANADDLRSLIFEYQIKGVNVRQVQALYEEARKFEKTNRPVEASLIVDKAYGNLSRKIILFGTSRGAFLVCILALIIILVLLIGITRYHEFIESEEILRVPLFIVTWGLIGSMSYVLISVYRKIRRQSFEWVDLAGYFYRFILGGVLAGISFYILQLGVASLPGPAGEGVSAAVASADEARDYREAFLKKEEMLAAVKEYRRLITEFERLDEEKDASGDLAEFLLENSDGWEQYNPEIKGERIVAARIEERLRDHIKKDRELTKANANLYDYVYAIYDAVEKLNTNEAEELLKKFNDIDDLEDQGEYLIKKEKIWVGQVKIPGEDSGMGVDDLEMALEEYVKAVEIREEAASEIRDRFKRIKLTTVQELEEKEGYAARRLEEYESNIRRWTGVFESVGLSDKLPKLNDEVAALEVEVETLDEEIWESREAARAKYESPPRHEKLSAEKVDLGKNGLELAMVRRKLGSEEKILLGQDKLDRSEAELGRKELELAAVREKLRAAAARDLARPFWEAPIFIVFAFLSGFSIEFITRYLKNTEETILGALATAKTVAGKAEPEEEGGDESEDEG